MGATRRGRVSIRCCTFYGQDNISVRCRPPKCAKPKCLHSIWGWVHATSWGRDFQRVGGEVQRVGGGISNEFGQASISVVGHPRAQSLSVYTPSGDGCNELGEGFSTSWGRGATRWGRDFQRVGDVGCNEFLRRSHTLLSIEDIVY